MNEARPAFYALAPGSWRDYVTLLHPPYTLWHLSYVAIGAGLAPVMAWGRLGATIGAFFLAVGLGAHALDELNGRPLATRIPPAVLIGIAAVSILGAVGIGIAGAVTFDLWLLVFVAFGVFIVVAYNLELFGGFFHNAAVFALAWGAFPLLTGYFAVAGRIRWEAVLAALFAALLSHAQKVLSTPVRDVRRRVAWVSGTVVFKDGHTEPVEAETLSGAAETALQTLAVATVALAAALLALHL